MINLAELPIPPNSRYFKDTAGIPIFMQPSAWRSYGKYWMELKDPMITPSMRGIICAVAMAEWKDIYETVIDEGFIDQRRYSAIAWFEAWRETMESMKGE